MGRGGSRSLSQWKLSLVGFLSGPPKRPCANSQQQASVNFVAQDGAAFERASLDSEIIQLWDLESLGIKSSDEVGKSLKNDIEFLDRRYSVKLQWKQGHNPNSTNFLTTK